MRKNGTYPYYDIPDLRTLRELVANGREKGPDTTAFYRGENNDIPLNFREVSDLIEEIGTWLLDQGFSGDNIALLGENSTEWVLSYFAVTNSGNTAVPMDTGLKGDELAGLAEHCECRALFCSDKYRRTAEKIAGRCPGIKVFRIGDAYGYAGEGRRLIDSGDDSFGKAEICSDTLACIVYTSGTSGKKKGVMLTHGNLASDVVAACRCVEGDNSQLLLPLHHTFAWASAMMAAFIYIKDLHISGNLRHILKDFRTNRPQNVSAVPMMVDMLYKGVWSNAKKTGRESRLKRGIGLSRFLMKLGMDRRKALFSRVHENFGGKLDIMICGGAALDPQLQQGLHDLGIEVLNGYGITECSPIVSVNRNHDFRFGSVGKPLPCNKVKIDCPDENGVGEILVSGSNVMKGYYKDPEATSEAFDGEWFRTGDYGRLDKDGFLYITGRKKNLIILANGENISPEELEEKLLRIEYVDEVVVYEDDNTITAEFYLNEKDHPDARSRLDEDVKKFNKTVSKSRNIGKIRLRDEPFEKTTTMKIKRHMIGKKTEGEMDEKGKNIR